jgi:hypothetical protein
MLNKKLEPEVGTLMSLVGSSEPANSGALLVRSEALWTRIFFPLFEPFLGFSKQTLPMPSQRLQCAGSTLLRRGIALIQLPDASRAATPPECGDDWRKKRICASWSKFLARKTVCVTPRISTIAFRQPSQRVLRNVVVSIPVVHELAVGASAV